MDTISKKTTTTTISNTNNMNKDKPGSEKCHSTGETQCTSCHRTVKKRSCSTEVNNKDDVFYFCYDCTNFDPATWAPDFGHE